MIIRAKPVPVDALYHRGGALTRSGSHSIYARRMTYLSVKRSHDPRGRSNLCDSSLRATARGHMFKTAKIKRVIQVPGAVAVKDACFAHKVIKQKLMEKQGIMLRGWS